jgi:hypothetical protein
MMNENLFTALRFGKDEQATALIPGWGAPISYDTLVAKSVS